MIARRHAVWRSGLLDADQIDRMKEAFENEAPVSDADIGSRLKGPVQTKHLRGGATGTKHFFMGHYGEPGWDSRKRKTWFTRRITFAIHAANDAHFGFDVVDRRGFQGLDFSPSHFRQIEMWPGSSCAAHMVNRNVRFADHKISYILLLSGPDEYGGGLIRVGGEALSVPEQRAAGTLIMFPSYCQYEIEPVTSGKLVLMFGCYEGPPWR